MTTLIHIAPTTATIIITTKNRKDELRGALTSCVRQSCSPDILVIDDGSNDGTSEMVRTEFPGVIVQRYEESRGLIVRRNKGAKLATTDVVVSIDDDAEFSHPDVVAQTLLDFDDPRVAAVAIPFINTRQDHLVHQRAPDREKIWITNEFIGTAHAVRREIFNRLGGYREFLQHQHEEGDFCIRLLDAGYYVRLGRSEPVLHHESPNRSNERIEVYGQRNLMLFAWHNVPMPNVLWHFPVTVLNGLRWGVKNRCLWFRCRGTVHGARAIIHEFGRRAPVSAVANHFYRKLKKHGPLEAQQIDFITHRTGWGTPR